MRFEVCAASPKFYRVRGLSSETIQYLKYTATAKFRFIDDGVWHVHRLRVPAVAQIEYAASGNLSYAALDDELQMYIAHQKVSWSRGKPRLTRLAEAAQRKEAYRTLHLHNDASAELVKVVWRHLASVHHPDKGGDAETFKMYLNAYNYLKET